LGSEYPASAGAETASGSLRAPVESTIRGEVTGNNWGKPIARFAEPWPSGPRTGGSGQSPGSICIAARPEGLGLGL